MRSILWLPEDRQRGIIIIRYGLSLEATSGRPPKRVNWLYCFFTPIIGLLLTPLYLLHVDGLGWI